MYSKGQTEKEDAFPHEKYLKSINIAVTHPIYFFKKYENQVGQKIKSEPVQ